PKVPAVHVAARRRMLARITWRRPRGFPTLPATAGMVWSDDYGQTERGSVPARLRRRPYRGQGAGSLRHAGAIQTDVACRQNGPCGMAIEAALVCRIHRRPD